MSVGVLISGGSAATVNTMNMKLLLKSLTLVVVSILVAGVFHIGWPVSFIPAAKSGVIALKILGWLLAPVVTAVIFLADGATHVQGHEFIELVASRLQKQFLVFECFAN